MKKLICGVLLVVMMLSILSVSAGCTTPEDNSNASASNAGVQKLICGITEFEPMNYLDENGEWTGFDTEFARLVGEKLGMTVEFQEIEWSNKYSELEAGTINCIWNGFTANSSDDGKKRSEYVDFSYNYMLNQQCVVVKAENADSFSSKESLAGKTIAAEKGSAGEDFAAECVGDGKIIDSAAQINTFIEVKSGAVDCAVVDVLLAQQIVGKGNYSDLVITEIASDAEYYAVGFKKGSDLRDKVNAAMMELYEDGTLAELAAKYGLENSLVMDKEAR